MTRSRSLLAVLLVALIVAYFLFDLGHYFSLHFLKSQQAVIHSWYLANPWQTALIYFLVYVAVTGLSLPQRSSPWPAGPFSDCSGAL
jgi:uncharacterized membrane protein YdjX (TVP38/TMEM64 family)